MYYVYIIESQKYRGWYIGLTEDIQKQIVIHNMGRNADTRNKAPYELIYYEAYAHRQDASKRASFLKTGQGKKILYQQCSTYLNEISRKNDS